MTDEQSDHTANGLTAGAAALVHEVQQECARNGVETPSIRAWLAALGNKHTPLVMALCRDPKIEAVLRDPASASDEAYDRPLPIPVLVERAVKQTHKRGRVLASERDVAAVVLTSAGHDVMLGSDSFDREEGEASPPPRPAEDSHDTEGPSGNVYQPHTAAPTPTLDKFGRDLTAEAMRGDLWEIVGRGTETELLIETLCRRTKRNPLLVGPAGVGKTAIVEGFAQNVVRGEVPEPLKDIRVIALQPSALVAGASVAGEFEKRIRAAIEEAMQPGVVLFIDEVHSLVGAGGRVGTTDAASLVKPALARGDLACIAATTDDEYRSWIASDGALERRFQPIRVQELTPEQSLRVVRSVRDSLCELRDVEVEDDVLQWLVNAAHEHLPNRYLPDSAIDLLEQSVAYALVNDVDAVDCACAETVFSRVVGIPADLTDALSRLPDCLIEDARIIPEDADRIVDRLAVTTRGLDIRCSRPNVVVMLADAAIDAGESVARVLAREICGSDDRVVPIDLGRLVNSEDVTVLVGAPPGYVGYSDRLPIHRIAQSPWSVLLLRGITSCHPRVLGVIAQALADGFFTDGTGKRVFLSNALVVISAEVSVRGHRSFGFAPEAEVQEAFSPDDALDELAEAVGAPIADQCDILITHLRARDSRVDEAQSRRLLDEICERYRQAGLLIDWDTSAVDWMVAQLASCDNTLERERLIDEQIMLELLNHVPDKPSDEVSVQVRCMDQRIIVERQDQAAGGN